MDYSLQIARQALLIEDKEGFTRNFACSPLLIKAYLNMIASGSSEETTLDQFLCVLGSKSVDDLNKNSLELMAVMTDNNGGADDDDDDDDDDEKSSSMKVGIEKGPIVSFVNGVWVDQAFKVKASFESILRSVYKVEPNFLDFQHGDEVAEEVNSWASSSTKGLIKEVIPMGTVYQSTMILLANALYFKGTWKDTFDVGMTEPRNFYLLNGETVEVPFMRQCFEVFKYGSFDGFKLIRLPYNNTGNDKRRFSMYFFLPDKREGLPDLIKQFNSSPSFVNQDFMLAWEEIDNLVIPKFKFNVDFEVSNAMVGLTPMIPVINVGELVEVADFPNVKFYRSINILQKCYVEIDEEGTQAAAVDSEECGCCLEAPPPLNFIADHPFLFIIREDTSRVALFIGAVINPLLG